MKKKFKKPNRVYIKSLKLDNFKTFGEKTEIELSPMVNLIFGKNSTGKSSILQAIRLLRQSYSQNQLTPFNLESPEKYKDNGGIDIDIQYRGIITDNKEKDKLSIGIKTGILSFDNLKFLDRDKEIIYEFKYDKKFYKSGDQLIKDKVLLNSLRISNKDHKIKYKLDFPKANKFDETSDIAYNLDQTISNDFKTKEEFKESKNIYKSLYSPYYYNVKLKELEIENLQEVFTDFKKHKTRILLLLKNISNKFDNKFMEKLKKRFLKDIDKDVKNFKDAAKVKDTKLRIKELEKHSDAFAGVFVANRVHFGLRDYSEKEIDEIREELETFISFLTKVKNYKQFEKYIFSDCSKKIERTVFYKGSFYTNPEKKFSMYQSKRRFARFSDSIEDKILYAYDFIAETINYYAVHQEKYDVLTLLRSFTHKQFDRGETSTSAYNDLNLCMEKMYVIPGLRSMPKRYFAKGIQTSYVGARAEHLAESLANPAVRDDTNKWLKKLEIPYSVNVINVENHYEIIWQPSNKKINIFQNHIGLGYPLILPFIVQCLTAKNNIIVVEEPEVHLHPKLQADLGDLIIESSLKNDNQIILETHSEDLLLRILKKIRKKTISPHFVSANYVLKNRNKPTEIKKIKINSDGQYFTPWKDDIFAERSSEFE